MAELTEEEKRAQAEALEVVQKAAEAKANEVVSKALEGVTFVSKEDAKKVAEEAIAKSIEEQKQEFERKMAELSASFKKQMQLKDSQKPTTFNENLAEAIEKHADEIRNFKKGSQELTITLKAVGDMSIANNFPGATPFIQDVRTGLIVNPYDRVWLSDILPQGTSTGNSVLYPKENGGEGGVDVWTNPNTDKPQVDFDLTSQAAFFKWIAGWVIVDREMLDDIPWLTSYLQNKLLISLKTAENNFILNGTTDTNPVTGLLTAATAYNGTFTNPVDRIIDAGWGQIVESTDLFYSPTHTILNPRAAVGIGLNKAGGSGEYDLPAGSVAFANGKLSIGGLTVVTSTGMKADEFLTFDRNAIMFLRRLAPEIRMFEDTALAKRNKVMFRIEERVTQAIFNNDAIVTGPLQAPAGGGSGQ